MIEEDIKKFLEEEGIERLGYSQWYTRLLEHLGGENAWLLANRQTRGLLVDNSPVDYYWHQFRELFYDMRIEFLKEIVQIIESFFGANDEFTVIDGGCAIGLDALFLAEKYRNAEFFGYDRNIQMVRDANTRKARRSLNNVSFYVGEHALPQEHEMQTADILYAQSSIGCEFGLTAEDIARQIIGAATGRVKSNGRFVLSGINMPHFTEISHILSNNGVHHLESKSIYAHERHRYFRHLYEVCHES